MSSSELPPVVGIDTASNRVHMYSSELPNTRQRVWTFKMDDPNPDARRHGLFAFSRGVFHQLPAGTWIFCEEPIALKNGQTSRLLSLAAGAIWAAHHDFDVFWYWVNISTWKSEVVGKGNASKELIQDHVQTAYDEEFDDEDSYDAYCIWRYGVGAVKSAIEASADE